MLPDYVILDTRHSVLDYLKKTAGFPPQFLFPLKRMGDAIFEVLSDRTDSDYKKALLKYEMLGDLLLDDEEGSGEVMEHLDVLLDELSGTMTAYGLYDSREFSQYVFSSWTPDHCALMKHFSLAPA